MHMTHQKTEIPEESPLALPPLPPHLAAIWGAFLHEGLMLASDAVARCTTLLDAWGHGCIELIQAVCEYTDMLWQEAQPYWDKPQGFPGIFEYEVVSVLGERVADYLLEHNGQLPDRNTAEAMIRELVVTFFNQGDDPEPTPPIPTTPSIRGNPTVPGRRYGRGYWHSLLRTIRKLH